MPRIFGYQITPSGSALKGPLTLLDAQASPVTIISYNTAVVKYIQLHYGLVRNGTYVTGEILITTDGTIVSISNDEVETGNLGVVFSATMAGAILNVQYTTTPTTDNATMTYYEQAWQ
jgi:hypothetical protein